MSGLIRIADLADPRLDPYRHLKDRDLARDGNRFIAESEQVVRRLIARGLVMESTLLAERRVEKMADVIPAGVAGYVLSDAAIAEIIGFQFHSGVMACAFRPPALCLETFLADAPPHATLMFLPEINNTENLGVLMRIAAAFGVSGLLLGERCCDPFYRQAVRVSMGSVFSLKIVNAGEPFDAISLLKSSGFETVATTLDPLAIPLTAAKRRPRTALLFGNESSGLSPQIVVACDQNVTIPMDLQTDSLNVAVAAGIVMHHYTQTLCAI